MPVPVMDIGIVQVPVPEWRMNMHVRVWLNRRRATWMFMLMVLIMEVAMGVHGALVEMLVLMAFRQVQPNPKPHQAGRSQERKADPLVENRKRDSGADERGHRKVRAGAGRTQVPEGEHEKGKADAVAHQPDKKCGDKKSGRHQTRSRCERESQVRAAGDGALDRCDL
jgi:hypothetical protein